MRPLERFLLILAGSLFIGLAVVGIFIPILPTTPFLLLAAACYARSSERFLHWLLHNRWFGTYIRNYREGRGMPRLTKALTLAGLWAALCLSAVFASDALWVRALLLGVCLGVTVHILRIPTFSATTRTEDPAPAAIPTPSPDET